MTWTLDLATRLMVFYAKSELLARGSVETCGVLFVSGDINIVLPNEGEFLPSFVQHMLEQRTECRALAVAVVQQLDAEHCVLVTVMPTGVAQFEVRLPLEVACRT